MSNLDTFCPFSEELRVTNTQQTAGAQTVSIQEQAEMKRLESKRRMTFIFFLAGLLFVLITFPTTLIVTSISWTKLFDYSFVSDFAAGLYIFFYRFVYALVAFIDPFIYASSNAVVKEKLRKTWRKICCCCCFCCCYCCRTRNNRTVE